MRSALAVWVALVCLAGAVSAADADPYEKTLRLRHIEPTAEGLNEYLRSLHPGPSQRERAARLIQQLGSSESFHSREEAMSQLLVLPVLPSEALIEATRGKDPEVRWRAAEILKVGKPEADRTLYAAFKVIEKRKIKGTAAELLRAIPLCDKSHLRYAARAALAEAASPQDAQVLKEAAGHTDAEVRLAATTALGKALGKQAVGTLKARLQDSDDRVRFSAAVSLINQGDREQLRTLVDLLGSDNLQVRTSASLALRGVSGKNFGFASYAKPQQRKDAVKKWQRWLSSEAASAELKLPVETRASSSRGYLGGNTLLAYGYSNKVAEEDPSGKEIWSYKAIGAWSAEKLADGSVLIAEYSGGKVTRVDQQGKVIWSYRVGNPLNAKPLDNGNVLIAVYAQNQAIEVTPDKEVVWRYKTPGNCADVHRLPNGNTLVGIYGRGVEEVTPEGEVVWKYGANQCYGIEPLQNGNVLIANFGQVLEVTREKQVVWRHNEASCVDAFRLPSGNTLITGGARFVEVTPDGRVVWQKRGCQYGSARR